MLLIERVLFQKPPRTYWKHALEDPEMSFYRIAWRKAVGGFCALAALFGAVPALAEGPDLIFRESTDFKLLTPNDKLATYGIDDPFVDGVVCYYTEHEKGGVSGALGLAENTSDVSLACRQYGPIKLNAKFSQGEEVFSGKRSLFFKRMHIVRGCDAKRNVLIYMAYSDKLVEGSPENSTSAVPINPWGSGEAPRCANSLK
jgi:CreA protein